MSDTQVEELQPAPDFRLPAIGSGTVVKDGQVQLSALRGHTIVLYFYPKEDWTPVNIGVYVISILG
jgi:peroxiredoxin Q/BCP